MKVYSAKQLINALNVAIETCSKKDLELVYDGVLIALDQIDVFALNDDDAIALDKAADKALKKLAA